MFPVLKNLFMLFLYFFSGIYFFIYITGTVDKSQSIM